MHGIEYAKSVNRRARGLRLLHERKERVRKEHIAAFERLLRLAHAVPPPTMLIDDDLTFAETMSRAELHGISYMLALAARVSQRCALYAHGEERVRVDSHEEVYVDATGRRETRLLVSAGVPQPSDGGRPSRRCRRRSG